jgi:hypothetical protein
MPRVRGRHKGVKYFFIETVKSLFDQGRGKSKHQAMQESFKKNKNRETQAIYSYSSYNTYKEVVAKFADFLESEHNVRFEKDFRKLSTEEIYNCVDRYFEVQKNENHLAKKTLQKHISGLYKVLGAINPEVKAYFTPDNRARWRDGVEKQNCDRYNNPDKIVENLHRINETAAAIAELQRLTGARIGDVKKLMIDEKNTRVFFPRSKGGRDRFVYFDRFQEDFERVKECKEILDRALEEKRFSEIRENEYYQSLRKACRKADEPYHGSHGFRYEFAQERYKEVSKWSREDQEAYYLRILEDRRQSEEDIKKAFKNVREKDAVAEAIISEELGHSRLDISREYLKLNGR